jgi:hypothetical protein
MLNTLFTIYTVFWYSLSRCMCVTWSWRTCILAFGFALKSGCDSHATKWGSVDWRWHVWLSHGDLRETKRAVCICSLGSTIATRRARPHPGAHTCDPTSTWSSSTCSCCTYAADLGPMRLDLVEKEQSHEPARSRWGGRGVCGDGQRTTWTTLGRREEERAAA